MKTIFAGLLMLALFGCSGSVTIGDGRLDAIESSVIQVAVGAAMSARPELIAPAYAVSTALLGILDGREMTPLATLELSVTQQLNQLELTDLERQSAMDLLILIKARILAELGPSADDNQKILVVKTVARIVNESARTRLNAI